MDSVPTQPAISSMASGSPSSRRHSSAIARGATSASVKPGSRSCALAMNSRTASDSAMSEIPAAADGQASGGTVQQTSPGTPSTTRLVTTTRRPSAATSRLPTSRATSSRRCSAPSSTSSRGAVVSAAATDSSSGTLGWSCTRRQDATAATSEAGWRTGSSGRNAMSGPGAARRSASIASRDFPAPPGPIRVTSRALPSSSPSSASSRSRPTNLDWAAGSGPPGGMSGAGARAGAGAAPAGAAATADAPPRASRSSNSVRARRAPGDIVVRPDSHRLTVAKDTPSWRASCSWLSPSLGAQAAQPVSGRGRLGAGGSLASHLEKRTASGVPPSG